MAEHLIDFGKVGCIQIDCGRIGGLGPAKRVADHAAARGVTYINHTFTSNLALSASLQPFAGLRDHAVCEYPTQTSALARDLTLGAIDRDSDGLIHVPDAPGLGVTVNPKALARYRVEVEIRVGRQRLFPTGRRADDP
jgi:L-alanine-DL-glutamate epimerase-like enolase superfamily enzyme